MAVSSRQSVRARTGCAEEASTPGKDKCAFLIRSLRCPGSIAAGPTGCAEVSANTMAKDPTAGSQLAKGC
jgi:hypothetical protein